jgi:hypothetical protein
MRILFVITLLLFSVSAGAGEKTNLDQLLESLPPMADADRNAFDRAIVRSYDPSCDCIRLVDNSGNNKGRIISISRKRLLVLDDSDRRLLIEAIKRGMRIPLPPAPPS